MCNSAENNNVLIADDIMFLMLKILFHPFDGYNAKNKFKILAIN